MTDQMLVTAHATVVVVTQDGNVDHTYHEDGTAPLLFGADGTLRPTATAVPDVLRTGLAPLYDGRIAFRKGATYLSAAPEGGFRTSASLGPSECFELVPASARRVEERAGQPSLPRKPRRSTIPRLLHQTCPPDLLPRFAPVMDDLRTRNPDWVHSFYSDKDQLDFIYDAFGWDVLRRYLRISSRYGAAKADFFRYLCIYQRGGVYLDVKSSCRVGLGELISPEDALILRQWDNGRGRPRQGWGLWHDLRHVPGGEFQQWHLIAAPGHPLLEAVILAMLRRIDLYDARLEGVGRVGTLRTTGPILYTRTLHPLLTPDNHRFLDAASPDLVYAAVETHEDGFPSHYAAQTTPVVC